MLAGRGWGKTKAGAEWVRKRASAHRFGRIALIGATAADVRDVMIEGESGILAVCSPAQRPAYEPSKRRLTWPNGTIATAYSADEPDRLRGPQHSDAWCDEICAWRYPEAWDQLRFGLRLGTDPRAVVTTTPRPTRLVRELLADPTTVVTRGATHENRANLPTSFLDKIVQTYEGTRLGRQELYAEVLEDTPGALWTRDRLESLRVREAPELRTIVIGVDPAVSMGSESAETGIVVAGIGREDGHGYVLDDRSGRYSPDGWAQRVVNAFDTHLANRVVAEANQGGDLVVNNLHTARRTLPVLKVHATRGKRTRAEPVAALYEQGRIHHVGYFGALEDQMCTWEPSLSDSPDRVDALVWALTELMVDRDPSPRTGGNAPPIQLYDFEDAPLG